MSITVKSNKKVQSSNKVNIYSGKAVELLKDSAKIAAEVLVYLQSLCKEGVTTLELDKAAEKFILEAGAVPAFKGYQDYPFTTCLSVNQDIVHGLPTNKPLTNGDVISIDVGCIYNGFYSDNCRTIIVGDFNKKSKHNLLVKTAEEAFEAGFKQAVPGNHIGDISRAIHKTILTPKDEKDVPLFKVFMDFQGHGIGADLHQLPNIPNMGIANTGELIQEGMCLCIEPVIIYRTSEVESYYTFTKDDVKIIQFKTSDKKPSSHYENQIIITKDGPEIISKV